MKKHKPSKRVKWWLEFSLYRLFEKALSVFSIETVFALGEFLGSVFYRVSPRYRKIVRRNLRVVLGKGALYAPSAMEVEGVFRRNIANMLTTIVAYKIKPNQLQDHLEVVGFDEVDESLKESGVILMLAHMGNWEVLTKFTEMLPEGTHSSALYRPLNNPLLDALIVRRRENAGMHLVSKKNPAYTLLKSLKKKGVVSILSDQKVGDKGTLLSFFGAHTPCTRLPHLLHQKTGSHLYVVQMKTVAPARWRLKAVKLDSPGLQESFDHLAKVMLDSYEDCFWLQDRWQEVPSKEWIDERDSLEPSSMQRKRLSCIVESRGILTGFLKQSLSDYELLYWDEDASPSDAYFAIGKRDSDFYEDCLKAGIKGRNILPPHALARRLKGPPKPARPA